MKTKHISVYLSIVLLYIAIITTGHVNLPLNPRNISSAIFMRLPVTILLIIVCTYGGKRFRRAKGWRKFEWIDVLSIGILCSLTISIGYLFFMGNNWNITSNPSICLILSLSMITALSEELYFRSFLLSSLLETGWKNWTALLISTIIFASLHYWQGTGAMLFAILSGGLYACYFLNRCRIITVILAHFIHNSVALILVLWR